MSWAVERIEAIRGLMQAKGWDAVIIKGTDPHCSEYFAPRWKQVEWISGYDGEGDLVITADHAGLWTDSRYFIQAGRQLRGTGIKLHKTRISGEVPIEKWLATEAFHEDLECVTIALDIMDASSEERLRGALRASGRHEFDPEGDGPSFRICHEFDLMDGIWKDRPSIPQNPITSLGVEYCGEGRLDKIARLRDFISAHDCDAILVSALDEIAWLLNVRGSDIEYNPLVISYLLVTLERIDWFVVKDPYRKLDSVTSATFDELRADGINIMRYDELGLSASGMCDGPAPSRLWVDPFVVNGQILMQIENGGAEIRYGDSPISLWKSIKNPVEIEGMRRAHLEDGLAMEGFMLWLETQMAVGEMVTEWDAAQKLQSLRAEIPAYRGDSFATISAYGENAALPHYVTPVGGGAILRDKGLYLCDSGGQYLYGTTDITRTISLGPCSRLEMEDYTLVLKGHIDLAMAVFPRGSAGCQIDAIARQPLWNAKKDYGHGTGHGVGFYLNVHEGPQTIRQNFNPQPVLPGMISSDEPGIYREGEFGVRHESLLLCRELGENAFGSWLGFEVLTLCHIDTAPVIVEMLTEEERKFLNDYNELVYRKLSPMMNSGAAQWLRDRTRPI